MFKTLTLFLAFNGLINCLQLTPTSFTPCTEIPNTIESVDVTPCSSEPCAFTRGTSVKTVTKFKPSAASNGCKLVMSANLGGWVPIVNADVCGAGLTCPLTAGATNTLDYSLTVSDALPAGLTQTKWTLNCDNGATEVLCANIQVNVN